jgi:hypothetical protein
MDRGRVGRKRRVKTMDRKKEIEREGKTSLG